MPTKSLKLAGTFRRRRPEDVGMDRTFLNRHRVSTKKQIAMGYMPGIAECVIKKNALVYVDLQGFQDREQKLAMSERSLHRCFSLTKPITAMGLMALWEDGKLQLDDPVSRYIPAFKHMKVVRKSSSVLPRGRGLVPARKRITLRHLMTHTSGLGYGPGRIDKSERLQVPPGSSTEQMYLDFVKRADSGKFQNLEAFCDALAKLPLRFQPGERYRYSMGMDVIGRVIEVVSGKPLDQFLFDRVLEPLGMLDTAFFVSPEKAKELLSAFYLVKADSKNPESNKPDRFVTFRRDGNRPEASAWVSTKHRCPKVLSGGGILGSCVGGLVSSLRDQAIFCNAIVNGGYSHATGRRVLKERTVKEMCQDWLSRCSRRGPRRKLRGWDDEGCQETGWCPLGFLEKGQIFFGGIGWWTINASKKTVVVSMSSSWCEQNDIHGWEDDVDDLSCSVKAAEKLMKKSKRRLAGHTEGRSTKRRRVEKK